MIEYQPSTIWSHNSIIPFVGFSHWFNHRLRIACRCSTGFKSRGWFGQGRRDKHCLENHYWSICVVCIGHYLVEIWNERGLNENFWIVLQTFYSKIHDSDVGLCVLLFCIQSRSMNTHASPNHNPPTTMLYCSRNGLHRKLLGVTCLAPIHPIWTNFV